VQIPLDQYTFTIATFRIWVGKGGLGPDAPPIDATVTGICPLKSMFRRRNGPRGVPRPLFFYICEFFKKKGSFMLTLANKHAVVTGGRRGIGFSLAMALHEHGAEVTVVSKSDNAGDLPKGIRYVRADLGESQDRHGLIERCGEVDILINNAGIVHDYPAIAYPDVEWAKMLEVNLTAVFDLSCQAVRKGCKRIIQIASLSAFTGARNIVGYTTAKHGLIGMTKCLSNEWAPLGVTVNNIAPGLIKTDMIQNLTNDPKRSAEIMGRIPVGRFGNPHDIVGAMLFLASETSGYVTGSTIVVDGGWLGR